MYRSLSLLSLLTAFSSSHPAPQAANGIGPGAPPCSGDSTNDTDPINGYVVQPNQWGVKCAVGDHFQCLAPPTPPSSNAVAWSTTFAWNGDTGIKSYANAYLPSLGATGAGNCKPMSSFKSMSSQWAWSFSSGDIKADVAYDIFLGGSDCIGPGATHPYEIMIWLGYFGGIQPIGMAAGPPVATFQGFALYVGTNPDTGGTKVYSFLAPPGGLPDWKGDIMDFLMFLTANPQWLAGSKEASMALLVQSVQAGTEIISGSATFTTSSYSVSAINA